MTAIAAANVALGIQGTLRANAVETSEVREQTATQANETPVLLAQFTCLPGGSDLVEFFKTDNFQVMICQKGGQLYYYGGSLGSMVAKRSISNGNSRVPALSSQLFGIVCNLSTLNPGEPLRY